MVLFNEAGEGGGPRYAVYIRQTDGSPAIRLGEGNALSLSPDGKWAMARLNTSPSPLILLPTGVGEMRPVKSDGLNHAAAAWLPEGKHIVFSGIEAGHGIRLYLEAIEDGKPKAISGEGVGSSIVLSPAGDSVADIGPDRKIYLYPLAGGDPRPVPGIEPSEVPTGWSEDGRELFVMVRGEIPARVFRVDIATGKRTLWRSLEPADSAGIDTIGRVNLSRDTKSYIYSYVRTLSDLYMVDGLK